MNFEENYYEDPLDDEQADFGEGFEEDFDAVSEAQYERAFTKALEKPADDVKGFLEEESELDENEYEFDSIVGGRDKKPIMSMLNKGKLSKYEMDDLMNQL